MSPGSEELLETYFWDSGFFQFSILATWRGTENRDAKMFGGNFTNLRATAADDGDTVHFRQADQPPLVLTKRKLQFDPKPLEDADGLECNCYQSKSLSYKATPDHTVTFNFISLDDSNTNIKLYNGGEKARIRVAGTGKDANKECPGCVTQLYIRFPEGESDCLESSTGGFAFDNVIEFTVPESAGVYPIITDWSWEFTCNNAFRGANVDNPIATLVVVGKDIAATSYDSKVRKRVSINEGAAPDDLQNAGHTGSIHNISQRTKCRKNPVQLVCFGWFHIITTQP